MQKRNLFLTLGLFILVGFLLSFLYFKDGKITGYQIIGGANVPQNLVEFKIKDAVGADGNGWVYFGMPLPEGNGLTNANNVRVLRFDSATGQYYEVYSDVWAQTMRPANPSRISEIWWIGVAFRADALLANQEKIYYIDYGSNVQRANPSQSLTVVDSGNYYTVDSGNSHVFEINKQAFDIFRRVSVSGQEIVLPNSGSGFEVKSSSGTVYSTANDVPTITIEQQGKLHVIFRIEGKFKDSLGSPFIGYVARLKIFNDGKVELPIVFQNKGNYNRNVDAAHKRFKDLSAVLNLNLGNQKSLMLTEFMPNQQVSYTTETYTTYQDFNRINKDFDALSYGQDLTPGNIVDNFLLRIIDNAGNTIYFEENEVESLSGTRSNGLLAVSDGSKKFSASVFDFWRESPKTLKVSGNNIRIGLFPEDSPQNYLVHDQGPMLRTYPAPNSNQYNHLTFVGWDSATLNEHALVDEGNYILHLATQEYEKLFFDFSTGNLNVNNEISFARRAQEQLIGLPPSNYFRTSNAFANRYAYVEEKDWTQFGFSQPLVDTASRVDAWGRSLWDEAYVTQPPLPGYPYAQVTFANRQKMGTDAGTHGFPAYGTMYNGQLFWQETGWMNNAFGATEGIMTALMRSRDSRAVSTLGNFIYHNSVDGMYVWDLVTDSIAGAILHEKGNARYGFYQGTFTPNSERHQWEKGDTIAKMLFADEIIKESLLYSAVDFGSGYPATPVGGAGRTLGIVYMTNSVDELGAIGPQLINLVGYYQMTGDVQYVAIAKEYLKTVKSIMQACENLYGVKIIVSPAINQNMLPNGLNTFNSQSYNCNPSSLNVVQFFTNSYLLAGILEVLEADYQINGQYDVNLKDFYVAAFSDYYNYLVKPHVNIQDPTIGSAFTPTRLYNNFHVTLAGASSPGATCVLSGTLPNVNYVLWVCNGGETTASAIFSGQLLPWLYKQTGNREYLDYATPIVRDIILYFGTAPSPAYGISSGYNKVAWRNPDFGSADVKVAMPWLWRFLPFLAEKSAVSSCVSNCLPDPPSSLSATLGSSGGGGGGSGTGGGGTGTGGVISGNVVSDNVDFSNVESDLDINEVAPSSTQTSEVTKNNNPNPRRGIVGAVVDDFEKNKANYTNLAIFVFAGLLVIIFYFIARKENIENARY